MKKIASLAVLGAAFAAVPFASATTLLYGHINTAGSSTYNENVSGPAFSVSSTGAATLDLVTPGSTSGSTTGLVTGPAPYGTLAAFATATITDYSFSTATISSATPTEILSLVQGADTVTFYATSTGAFTASTPATEGSLVLYGYLADAGPTYSSDETAELDIDANGLGNNFTEDLTAATPEPSSLMLLGTGLLSAGGMLTRRRKTVA